jgi:hypothetical protein
MLYVVCVMIIIIIGANIKAHDMVVLKPKRMLNPLQVNLPFKPWSPQNGPKDVAFEWLGHFHL